MNIAGRLSFLSCAILSILAGIVGVIAYWGNIEGIVATLLFSVIMLIFLGMTWAMDEDAKAR